MQFSASSNMLLSYFTAPPPPLPTTDRRVPTRKVANELWLQCTDADVSKWLNSKIIFTCPAVRSHSSLIRWVRTPNGKIKIKMWTIGVERIIAKTEHNNGASAKIEKMLILLHWTRIGSDLRNRYTAHSWSRNLFHTRSQTVSNSSNSYPIHLIRNC